MNVVLILLLIGIVSVAGWYVCRSKRRGSECIGCPYAKECGGNCGLSDKK